jgi:two-component system sensor histidine kinase KdpD
LYVQTPKENSDKIALHKQRYLINNFKLAAELGAEIIRIESTDVVKGIIQQTEERKVTTVCMGTPHFNIFKIIMATSTFNDLLKKLSTSNIDLIILS